MKLTRSDGKTERMIIMNMIMDDQFLQDIMFIYHPEFIKGDYARIISAWCIDYFKKYNKSPKKDIEKIYYQKIKTLNTDVSSAIETLLSKLSTEYVHYTTERKKVSQNALKPVLRDAIRSITTDSMTNTSSKNGKNKANNYVLGGSKRLKQENSVSDRVNSETSIQSKAQNTHPETVNGSGFDFDEAERYFRHQSLEMLSGAIKTHLEKNNVEDAEKLLRDHVVVQFPKVEGIEPLDNESMFQKAYEEQSQPIFKYPGALGKMLNYDLCEESFVAFMAPEKRGKTWWLQDMVLRACMQRKNVALFQAGDMSDVQWIRREGMYLTKKPYKEVLAEMYRYVHVPASLFQQTIFYRL